MTRYHVLSLKRPWAALLAQARHAGGIVGVGTLSSIGFYSSAEQFDLGRDRHLNDPDWFEPGGLYGFSFADLRPTPFRRLTGQVRLFRREMDDFAFPDVTCNPTPSSHRAARLVRSLTRLSASPRGGEPA